MLNPLEALAQTYISGEKKPESGTQPKEQPSDKPPERKTLLG